MNDTRQWFGRFLMLILLLGMLTFPAAIIYAQALADPTLPSLPAASSIPLSQLQHLTGTNNSYFGTSIALSSDGNTALIGARGENSLTGAVYIFVRSGTSWTEQQRLSGTATNSNFGYSVALNSDATTALIGAPSENNQTGATYLFARSGTSWTEQQRLTGSTATGSNFGTSVALNADCTTALVGANTEMVNVGAVYVFGIFNMYAPLVTK